MAKKATSKPLKIAASSKPRTKSQVFKTLAEATETPKKAVEAIFDVMGKMIAADLSKSGPRMFTVPGLMKVVARVKPATPAKKGRNPATGEEIMIKAKPARTVVKVRPLKALKEMV